MCHSCFQVGNNALDVERALGVTGAVNYEPTATERRLSRGRYLERGSFTVRHISATLILLPNKWCLLTRLLFEQQMQASIHRII